MGFRWWACGLPALVGVVQCDLLGGEGDEEGDAGSSPDLDEELAAPRGSLFPAAAGVPGGRGGPLGDHGALPGGEADDGAEVVDLGGGNAADDLEAHPLDEALGAFRV